MTDIEAVDPKPEDEDGPIEAENRAEEASEEAAEEEATTGGLIGFLLVPAMVAIVAMGLVALFWTLTYDRRTVRDYTVQLSSPDKATRWQAALDLIKTNRGSSELAPILIDMLDAPEDEQMLDQRGWQRTDILKTSEERRLNLRWYAAMALGSVGGRQAYDKLIELTSDEDIGVRLYSVLGLAMIRSPEAVDRLGEVLGSDDDFGTRAAAAFALGEIADPRAVEALRLAYAEDENVDVKRNSAIALARFSDPLGEPTLKEMLDDPDAPNRTGARKALGLLARARTAGELLSD